ncbi:ABC transporter permease [Microbacterium sp. C7(2022)]|uniref:ABC transporter permease n=1 Tax=Microbacterium sp. C7(2022) TaxID=2992759 RepID=UPI00237B1F65|nr:ABC transporter permease [Microbacterium sp. C7(2022)]MDE0547326.1 ABC transporter permease [Microbacterium sp. C7(2022)]
MTTIDYSAFDTPGRGRGLLDVFRYRYLLRLLIGKSTSLRYRNSVLGWFWSYVRPAVQFLVYYLVVGQVLGMHKNVPSFPLYLFSGIVLVNLFNEAFGAATRSVVDNKALVRKIYLPRELFPIAAVVGSFIHFLPQLAILVVASLLFGWLPDLASIGLMLAGMAIVLVSVLAAGLFFSAVNVRFRDAQNLVEIVRTIATWSVPILYTWVMVKDVTENIPWLFHVYMSNPLAVAVELFHHAFWARLPDVAAASPAPENLAWPEYFGIYATVAVALCACILAIGQYVFRRLERSFAQDL